MTNSPNDSDDEIRIPIKGFFDEYSSVMPEDIFLLYLKSNNSDFITLKKSVFDTMVEEKRKRQEADYLLRTTARLNNEGIGLEKQNIDEAIKVYEQNIKLGYPATHSFDRLGILYRKKGDIENEKRVLRRRYEVFKLPPSELEKELERIDNKVKRVKLNYILPQKAKAHKVFGLALGLKYQQIITQLPEFNFYFDKPVDEDTNTYLFKNHRLINDYVYKPQLWEIQKEFKKMIADAEKYKSNNDLDSAATIYEKIVAEQCYISQPYDKLQQIYNKAGLNEDAKRVLIISIDFFSALRDRQKSYVLNLASKYGKLDFALQYINDGKKIYYYGGAFELYNPFPIIDNWQKRLSILT